MTSKLPVFPELIGCICTEAMLRSCAKKKPAHCDMLEVRLDMTGLCNGEWLVLCAKIQHQGLPVLLTIRSAKEGGMWKGCEEQRLALYSLAMSAVSAVDVELGASIAKEVAAEAKANGVRLIGSYHNFKQTPPLPILQNAMNAAKRLRVDVTKLATMICAPEDLARLCSLLSQTKRPLCILGMGELGRISRLAFPCAGSCLAYAALGNETTAPGQWRCDELAKALSAFGARPLR